MAPTKPPTVTDLILEAVENLKVKGSPKGVSRTAIKNYIGDRSTVARINLSLKRLVSKESLVQVKESFKFPPKRTSASSAGPIKKKKPATATKKKTTAAKKKKPATKPKKVRDFDDANKQ